jgi:hypothetical protein
MRPSPPLRVNLPPGAAWSDDLSMAQSCLLMRKQLDAYALSDATRHRRPAGAVGNYRAEEAGSAWFDALLMTDVAPKEIVRAPKFASFRHGGFTEAADADLTDAQLGAISQRGSSRPTPNAHVSSSSMSPKSGVQSERVHCVCHNERLTGCQNGENTTGQPVEIIGGRTRTRTLDPLIKSHRKTVKDQGSF